MENMTVSYVCTLQFQISNDVCDNVPMVSRRRIRGCMVVKLYDTISKSPFYVVMYSREAGELRVLWCRRAVRLSIPVAN